MVTSSFKFSRYLASLFTIVSTSIVLLSATFANAENAIQLPPASMKVPLAITSDKQLGVSDENIGLAVGSSVPAFTSKTHLGETVNAKTLLKDGPALVIFYRGGWCPYCNIQIRQLTEAYSEFQQRGVTPVLISVDETDGAALAQKTYDIPFPVLSDSDLSAHKAFNVTMEIDAETVEQYKQYGIDLNVWSKRDHHTIAYSSAFLIDTKGKVLWSQATLDYKTRPSPAQLLGVIDKTLK